MAREAGVAAAIAMAALAAGWGTAAGAVTRTTETVDGLKVFTFGWTDATGLKRTVSLKREGAGNPGHGGYAVRMTYRYVDDGATRTRTARAPAAADGGFGYFVAHERYRSFVDGRQAPIANKIFKTDDSPLGLKFPVKTRIVADGASFKAIEFRLTYPKYGAKAPGGIDPETGEDKPKLGLDRALFKRYDLPVTIRWSFEDGKDSPRIGVTVDLSPVPGPDRVSFDMRGPYGKIDFDGGDNVLKQAMWADRFAFETTAAPLTRDSTWTWRSPNAGARFTVLIAGTSEMGLLEPRPYARSRTNDGYAEGRKRTSATYNGGNGCSFQDQLLPCDYEWPYQSAQYELPYGDPGGTTTSEKIAWGSTPYYGTSLSATSDGVRSTPFDGFPEDRKLAYDVCVLLGETAPGGITKRAAADEASYSCASAD